MLSLEIFGNCEPAKLYRGVTFPTFAIWNKPLRRI